MLLKENSIFLALQGLYQLEQSKLSFGEERGTGRVKKTEYADRAAFRANTNFLLAAAVHRLCLADDLTLHVTCGDITHSCERKTKYGLRARCLPSKKSQNRGRYRISQI